MEVSINALVFGRSRESGALDRGHRASLRAEGEAIRGPARLAGLLRCARNDGGTEAADFFKRSFAGTTAESSESLRLACPSLGAT